MSKSVHDFLESIRTTLEFAEQESFLISPTPQFVTVPHDESVEDASLIRYLHRFVARYASISWQNMTHLQRTVHQAIARVMHFEGIDDLLLWCVGDELELATLDAYHAHMRRCRATWRNPLKNQEQFLAILFYSMNWMIKSKFTDFKHKYRQVLEEVSRYLISDLAAMVLGYD